MQQPGLDARHREERRDQPQARQHTDPHPPRDVWSRLRPRLRSECQAVRLPSSDRRAIAVAIGARPTLRAAGGRTGRHNMKITEDRDGARITHEFEEMTPEKRPQDPGRDGRGRTFETVEHGGEYPDTMPQAIKLTDAEG